MSSEESRGGHGKRYRSRDAGPVSYCAIIRNLTWLMLWRVEDKGVILECIWYSESSYMAVVIGKRQIEMLEEPAVMYLLLFRFTHVLVHELWLGFIGKMNVPPVSCFLGVVCRCSKVKKSQSSEILAD